MPELSQDKVSAPIVEEEISPENLAVQKTAGLVAYCRAKTGLPFAQEMCERANGAEAVKELLGNGLENPFAQKIIMPMLELRQKSIKAQLDNFINGGTGQVMEIGCGLSTYAMEMSDNPGITYLQTDLLRNLKIKESVIKEFGFDLSNHLFREADVTDSNQLKQIDKECLEDGPVIGVMEGVVPYIKKAEKPLAFQNIFDVLSRHGGNIIVTDMMAKADFERLEAMGPLKELMQKFFEDTGLHLKDEAWESEEEARQILESIGFKVDILRQIDVFKIENLDSIKQLDMRPEEAEQILQNVKMWILSVNKKG